MNISEVLSYAKTQVTESKNKLSLALFAVLILRTAYLVLYWLLYALFGAGSFFSGILSILNVLGVIASIVLAVCLILLFVRNKQPLHLVAGILLIINCLSGGVLSSICWLGFVICIALPALKCGEENAANTAKLALLATAVNFVLGLLTGAFWRMPRFLVGILMMICAAVALVQLVLVAVCFLREAQDDQAKEVVEGLVSKAKNRSGSAAQPQAEAVPPLQETTAPAPAEAPAETPAEPEAALSAAAAAPAEVLTEAPVPAPASGGRVNYRYKTVAGPVGLTVDKNTNYADGVTTYAAVIARESCDGWVFDSIHEIPVTKNNGCLAALMGRGSTTVYFNMLIFRKEV